VISLLRFAPTIAIWVSVCVEGTMASGAVSPYSCGIAPKDDGVNVARDAARRSFPEVRASWADTRIC
jgi:hypothetical protein